ncbi:MAG: ABC transporter substrate-binding protein [Pikeienuella sp.]
MKLSAAARHLLLVCAIAVTLGLAPLGRASGAEAGAARAVAETLVEDAHGALADPALSDAQRNAQLKSAVSAAFAFDIWERFLLGDQADGFTDAQRAKFRAALPGFLADLYKNQFGQGLEAKPEIRETRPARTDVLVQAGIPRAKRGTLPVDWRIRDFGDRGHLVIDVMVGGVSFGVLKREEFAEIRRARGPEGRLAFMAENSL